MSGRISCSIHRQRTSVGRIGRNKCVVILYLQVDNWVGDGYPKLLIAMIV